MPTVENKQSIKATFILVAYNHAAFIREAVAGALAQDYPDLEIIISDDCSTDETFAYIQEMAAAYQGNAQLVINRNPQNMGLTAHVNSLINRAKGSVVLLAAGDDVSLPGRTRASVVYLQQHPDTMMVSLQGDTIAADGTLLKAHTAKTVEQITLEAYFTGKCSHPHGAARAFHKQVFTKFGDLLPTCPTEDTTLLFRALMLGKVAIVPETGVLYRWHGNNFSSAANMQKVRADGNFVQYRHDITNAEKQGIISPTQAQHYHQIIDQYQKKRDVLLQFDAPDSTTLRKLGLICSSRVLRLREKLSLLKRMVVVH